MLATYVEYTLDGQLTKLFSDPHAWEALKAMFYGFAGVGATTAAARDQRADWHQEPAQPIRAPLPTAPINHDVIGLQPIQRVDVDVGAVDRVMSSKYFSQAELECKGMDCNCEYPGMDRELMTKLDALRDRFGPIVINSGYRCAIHNQAVGGGPGSYHKKGMAGDIRAQRAAVTPKVIYDYLDSKYPEQYGLGLYKNFVHFDTRPGYARKTGPEQAWH